MPSLYRRWFIALLAGLCPLAPAAGAPAPGDNLLRNAGFEEAAGNLPAGWDAGCTGGSTAVRDETRPHTGSACAHIVKVADGKSHVAALVFPRVEVQGGAQYTLSGWGRGDVPQGRANLFLYQYDKEGKWLGNFLACALPAKADAWIPLQATQKVRPECAWVQVRFEIFGETSQGEACVDDVYFGQDTTPPGAVREIRAVAQGSRVKLTWQAPEGETPFGYRVYRAPYRRFEPSEAAAVAFTQEPAAEVELPKGFVYYYAVCALDQALNRSPAALSEGVKPPGGAALPRLLVWADGPGRRWDLALPASPPQAGGEISLELARGEYGNAQVLAGAPQSDLRTVQATVGPLKGPRGVTLDAKDVTLFQQDYVEMPGQARFAPDPLPPARPAEIGVGEVRGWWLLIRVPDDAPAGRYAGKVTITAAGERPAVVPVHLKVWPVTMPRGNHYGGSWGVWGAQMAAQEGVAVNSPEYRRILRRYLDFFLEHRMVPRELPGALGSPEAEAWLRDERVSSFAIPSPAGWSKKMADEQVPRFRELTAGLREKGWLSRGYAYWADEPEEKDYAFVVELARQAHEAGKDVPFLMTEQPEPALYGAVDIWCPILNLYAETEERCRERQRLGEHVWWYVCLAPAAPWPNYMLTNDPIDARALSWLQVKKSVEGELYWAVTCFPGDVWAQALPARWPGDGYLCYPGRPRGLDGPVTSIRAEMIRAAKQDIELIWLLRHLAAGKGQQARAEEIIRRALAKVCTDFTHYTKADADVTAARRMLLDEIVRLSPGEK